MKLCFISIGPWSVDVLNGKTSSAGGAEAQIAYLAAAFAQRGIDVDLIYQSEDQRSVPKVIQGVNCLDAYPAWKRPASITEFWRALEQSNPDWIYSRLPHDFMWVLGLYVNRHPGTKFIYAVGNDKHCNPWHTYYSKGWFHNPLYVIGLRTANIVAIQHEGQEQMIKPYIRGEIVLIPNLVRAFDEVPRNFDDSNIDVLWISHIRPQKRLSTFLDIAEQMPQFRFVVIGGFGAQPDRNALERRMKEIQNLRYLGAIPYSEVVQLLRKSKILVNTSAWEGFPNTMLDAWSVGVPVVSLEIDPGGVISQNKIGIVSKNRQQMMEDIKRLVEDRSVNYETGKRGMEYVKQTHGINALFKAFNKIMPNINFGAAD